jgi:hypothetical protein
MNQSISCCILLLTLALAACRNSDPSSDVESADAESVPRSGPALIGRIASVAEHRQFVLVQCYRPWAGAAGAILTTRGSGGRVANLLVTGETMGSFVAADIQSGQVMAGDAVYTLQLPPTRVAEADPAQEDSEFELPIADPEN